VRPQDEAVRRVLTRRWAGPQLRGGPVSADRLATVLHVRRTTVLAALRRSWRNARRQARAGHRRRRPRRAPPPSTILS